MEIIESIIIKTGAETTVQKIVAFFAMLAMILLPHLWDIGHGCFLLLALSGSENLSHSFQEERYRGDFKIIYSVLKTATEAAMNTMNIPTTGNKSPEMPISSCDGSEVKLGSNTKKNQ